MQPKVVVLLPSSLALVLFPFHWDLTDLKHVHGGAYHGRGLPVADSKLHVALDHLYFYQRDVLEHAWKVIY